MRASIVGAPASRAGVENEALVSVGTLTVPRTQKTTTGGNGNE